MNKILITILLIISSFAYAQDEIIITGKLTDVSGEALLGVTVVSDGNGTYSDMDGNFSLKVKNDPKTKITFSAIGLETKIVELGAQKIFNLVLKEEVNKLDDIVVIGYGTQKRTSVTGSISKVKSEKIENAPVVRVDQALQGKIAGVQIRNTSSEAGSDPQINIRGISSINAAQGPLIVVDGQPIPDGFASINNADVESIEVLKDAASAAIYGSRGAGGVILITTKSGKADKAKYTIRNSIGFKTAYETHPMISSSDYVRLLFKERDLKLQDPTVTNTSIASNMLGQYAIEQNFLGGQGTDYQDEVLRTAIFKDIQFNVSGGNKNLRYFVSSAYQQDEGMMLKSNSERLNFRSKLDIKLTEKVKLNINLNPSHVKTEFPGPNYTDFYRFATFLPKFHNEATAAFVNQAPQWANIRPGDIAEGPHFYDLLYSAVGPDGVPFSVTTRPFNTNNVNPLGGLENRDENRNQFRFQGGTALTYDITKDLSFRTSANIYHRSEDRVNWASTNAVRFLSPNTATFFRSTYFDFLTENTLNYKKELGSHSIDAVAGYTFQSTETKGEQVTGFNFPTDDIRTLSNAGSIDQSLTRGRKDKEVLISYLTRVSYSYKDKYQLTASYRADGSSRFADGNRWSGFPAVSAGWVVSKENFMVNVNQINRLGFRASYGISGNNRIDQIIDGSRVPITFGFQNILNNSPYVIGTGTGNATIGQGSLTNVAGNPDLTWERTFQTNLGMDLTAFNNRLDLTFDVFQSLTDQLLLEQPTQSFSGTNRYLTNVGSLRNNGFEIELETKNINTNNFKWSTSLNFSRVINKIDNLGNVDEFRLTGERNEIYQNKVGNPLVQFFGFKTDGVWLSQAEINDAVANGLTVSNVTNYLTPGGLKIVDINGDGKIDLDDRTVLGNPYPDFTWGVTNNFTYKNFNLSFTFQGVQGGSIYNGDLNYNESRQRNEKVIANRWISAANPGDGKTPFETNGVQWMLTDYLIEDASYASLREVNLGYTFNNDIIKKFHLSGLRFFLSGQNLYFVTASGYRGINPETRNQGGVYNTPLIDGYQRGGFPIPRTIIFGAEVNF